MRLISYIKHKNKYEYRYNAMRNMENNPKKPLI